MKIRFVTGNPGKFSEVQAGLPGHELVMDRRGYPEVQADTLAQVVQAGASALRRAGLEEPFLLEDSGLFIPSLEGFPGPYTRYVFETLGPAGIVRLAEGRPAVFKTAFLLASREDHVVEGACEGMIVAPRGAGGFGFDPIFVPAGKGRTFAEMTPEQKGRISHRGMALLRLRALLGETAKT